MDISQVQIPEVQSIVENFLNIVNSYGPQALAKLVAILVVVKQGAAYLKPIADLIAQYPLLIEAMDKLVILIQSGATIHEIAMMFSAFVSSLGISAESLLTLIYLIAPLIGIPI
jgi:hypothetical protein